MDVKKGEVKVGDILVGHRGRDFHFFEVGSFTASGLPRVNRLPVEEVNKFFDGGSYASYEYKVDTTPMTSPGVHVHIRADESDNLLYYSRMMSRYEPNKTYKVEIYY